MSSWAGHQAHGFPPSSPPPHPPAPAPTYEAHNVGVLRYRQQHSLLCVHNTCMWHAWREAASDRETNVDSIAQPQMTETVDMLCPVEALTTETVPIVPLPRVKAARRKEDAEKSGSATRYTYPPTSCVSFSLWKSICL